jgi:hypothetical protein
LRENAPSSPFNFEIGFGSIGVSQKRPTNRFLKPLLIAKAFPKQRDEIVIATKVSIVGALLAQKLALIYAWTDKKDLAFEQLSVAAKLPVI